MKIKKPIETGERTGKSRGNRVAGGSMTPWGKPEEQIPTGGDGPTGEFWANPYAGEIQRAMIETLRKGKIRTDEDVAKLIAWLREPRIGKAVNCRNQDHTPPFRLVADVLSGRVLDYIAWANRSGGKTYLAGLIAWVSSGFTSGLETTILGGSFEQSGKVYEAMNGLWGMTGLQDLYLLTDPTKKKTKWKNGSYVSVLTASTKSTRGPHPHRLILDEVDEMNEDVYRAALSQPMAKKGIKAGLGKLSTNHKFGGMMDQAVENARAAGIPIYKWCVTGGTLVRTDRGEIPIQEMDGTERVLTLDGYRKIDFVGETGKNQVLRIKTNGNRELQCTSDHLIFTKKGWKPAGELRQGDEIFGHLPKKPRNRALDFNRDRASGFKSRGGEIIVLDRIREIEKEVFPVPVFDLTIKDGPPHFFAAGILVHNCIWEVMASCRDLNCSTCKLSPWCPGKHMKESQGYYGPEDFIQKLENLNEHSLQVEWFCNKIGRDDLVYGSQFEEEIHAGMGIPDFDPNRKAYISLDWGGTDPFSLGLWQEFDIGWVRVDEIYLQNSTNTVLINQAKKRPWWGNISEGVADPSRPDLIKEWRAEGIILTGANNEIDAGIETVRNCLQPILGPPRFYVNRHRCRSWLAEIKGYLQKNGHPIDRNNHAMDETRYFCMWKISRPLRRGRAFFLGRVRTPVLTSPGSQAAPGQNSTIRSTMAPATQMKNENRGPDGQNTAEGGTEGASNENTKIQTIPGQPAAGSQRGHRGRVFYGTGRPGRKEGEGRLRDRTDLTGRPPEPDWD